MELRSLISIFVLMLGVSSSVQAVSNNTWDDISTVGAIGLASVALGTPTVRGDWQGLRESAFSLGVASGVSLGLKSVVHEQRPDHSDNNSFPSGHSVLAFSSATTLYRRYGWEVGFPAYAVATLTGAARVAARKHHWYDVAAGAAIGSASGWYFTDAYNDRVRLLPWADSKGVGVLVTKTW